MNVTVLWIWVAVPDLGSLPYTYAAVASSADGMVLATIDHSSLGYIYVALGPFTGRSPITWTPQLNAGKRQWACISISADGLSLAAGDGAAGGSVWTAAGPFPPGETSINWQPQIYLVAGAGRYILYRYTKSHFRDLCP